MTLDDPFALAREPVPDAEFDPSAEFPRTAAAIRKLALAVLLVLPNYDVELSSLAKREPQS
jgi:hypothetical protein